ncbi:MAG: HAMP domain-containing histidine kinase [Ignavibacteriaceae bacterium]|nr:HAMP domain-containing histidine kinase [Ignavibacteriaceae bacterium]
MFISLNNPVILSFILMVIVLSLTYIFYRYVIVPMRKKHIEEEENIRLQHAKLMAMFAELDPSPVFRFDLSGEIILTNNAGNKLLVSKPIPGEKIYSLLPELKDINLAKCINEGEQLEITSSIGDKIYQFTVCGLPHFKIGQIYGRDVSALKAVQEKLELALKKSEESEKLKSYFLSQLSHEIRTPMVGLSGFSGFLKESMGDVLTDEQKTWFLHLENASKRLNRTMDLFINMAQVLTGGLTVYPVDINPKKEIETILKEYEKVIKEKNLYCLYEDLSNHALLKTDQYSFNLVMQNLIDNAIKFTKKGSIKITSYFEKNKFCISVADTGIGISEEYLQKIFTPFSQEVMGYSRPYEGNGLGLALAKNLLALNNATIEVKSEKGKGSTFSLIFNWRGVLNGK